MTEDAEVGSKMTSTTKSAKNLPLHIAEDAEISDNGNGGNNEMVERSPSRKPSKFIEYLASLRSNVDSAPFEKRWAHLIILTIVEASN